MKFMKSLRTVLLGVVIGAPPYRRLHRRSR
jgi:hypothetical protein